MNEKLINTLIELFGSAGVDGETIASLNETQKKALTDAWSAQEGVSLPLLKAAHGHWGKTDESKAALKVANLAVINAGNASAGDVPADLARQLQSIGAITAITTDGGGYQWNVGREEEYLGFLEDFTGETFTRDTAGLDEANQAVQDLGPLGREDFMMSVGADGKPIYPMYSDALTLVMDNGKTTVIRGDEIAMMKSVLGVNVNEIGRAARMSAQADFRLTLLAYKQRQSAGLEGSVQSAAMIVRRGLEMFNGNQELAYMYAAEFDQENADAYRRGEAGATRTTAEEIFSNPGELTSEHLQSKTLLMDLYTRLVQSDSMFTGNFESINALAGLGLKDRSPTTDLSEGEVRKTFRDLYTTLFMETPDEETLSAFQGQFESDIAAWSAKSQAEMVPWSESEIVGDPYGKPDATSSARGFVESTDLYEDLYGESFEESGMTEEGWAARFGNRAQSSFSSPDLIRQSSRAGMRSGDVGDVGSFGLTEAGVNDPKHKEMMLQGLEIMRNL